ncbi:MAG: hypothetical protein U9R36_02715 [Elusimicrobiota bacterium]|nr:hypothetical protein [Elusimicrobiota bacterium]
MQNNISAAGEGTEGFTEFFKNRLVMPILYSDYDFEHLIAHEFTHQMQIEILYGGFWRSPRLVKGLSGLVPLWIMEGQAEYYSHRIYSRPWSSYDKMILRDAALNDRLHTIRELHNFNALYPYTYQAYKEAHSAIDFLVQQEGEEVNYRLLKEMRNNIDPVKAFELATEEFVGMKDFNNRWHKRIKEKARTFSEGRASPEDTVDIILGHDDYNYRNPVPAGEDSFYYISNRRGPSEIYYYDGKKSRNILKNYFNSDVKILFTGRRQDRPLDYCRATGDIVFLAKDVNNIFLGIYNPSSGDLQEIDLAGISETRSVSISPDGTKILFTGLEDFNRSIYIYHRASGDIEKIDESGPVDYSPVFYPSGDKILTVTERSYNTDLRTVDLKNSSSTWLTQTPCNERDPAFDPESGKLYYCADKNGAYNIFTEEGESLTDIETGLFYPAPAGGDMLMSVWHNGTYRIGRLTASSGSKELALNRNYLAEPSTETFISSDIEPRDYSFSFSTDFFLPSFLYSTEIGFIGGGYYMASDMLGRHNLSLYGWGWPGLHSAQASYLLQKWRPDISMTAYSEGEKYYKRDSEGDRYLFTDHNYYINTDLSYPLNNFNALSLWGIAAGENEYLDEVDGPSQNSYHETETGVGLTYSRNTASIVPFMPLSGGTLRLSVYSARPWEKFSRVFNTYTASARRYIPFSRKLNWSNRAYYARSEGPDSRTLKLDSNYVSGGTSYRLRGYPRGEYEGNNLVSLSSEIRYMLFPDIKWHIYFMWPDINIDSLTVKIFTDGGAAWYDGSDPDRIDRWGKSWGAGCKLNIYLMQMIPGFLDVEFARPYGSDEWRTYIQLETSYLKW